MLRVNALVEAVILHLSIEIKDPDNNPVLFTAVDWTEKEQLIAVAQIMRLAGLPDDKWSPGDEPGREVPEPIALAGSQSSARSAL